MNNSFILSDKVIKFKQHLVENVNKLIPNSVIYESIDIGILLEKQKCVDLIYPGFGNNLDLINKYAYQKQIIINNIYRDEDLSYWDLANSGFYKFKTSFHKLNNI